MTGTVIDSLVVTLGLDPSDFTKGQKAAAESLIKTRDSASVVAKDMEAKGKQAAAFFSQVKNEALGLIGVLLGAQGLESFVRQTTTSLVAMGNAARNIGMPIGELDAFGMMVKRHGGTAEAATASFQKLTDAANNFAILGQGSQYASVMTMLGLNPGAKGIDVYSALLKYASANNNPRGVQMTRLWGQMLGLDEGTMNTLFDQVAKGGIAQFQREMAESMKLGVRTPEMSKAAKDLTHDWNALTEAVGHFGDVMLTKAQPYLSQFLQWNTEMVEKNPATTLAIEGITSAFLSFSAMATLTKLFGLTAISEKLLFISRFMGLLGLWATVSSLSGDTPGGGDGYKPPPGHVPGFLNDLWYQYAPERWGGRPGSPHAPSGPSGPPPASHSEFIRKYMPYAIQAGRETGVDPRIILAQAALESNWGTSAPGNNLFGIKGGNGPFLGTREFINGQWVNTGAQFRQYGSPEESFKGYADFINNNPRYSILKNRSLDSQLDMLQQSGYATAPNYSDALRGIMRQFPAAEIAPPAPMNQYVPSALGGGGHSSSNKNVNIGDVHVYTQSTDAHGISKEINAHLSRAITDSNRGLE